MRRMYQCPLCKTVFAEWSIESNVKTRHLQGPHVRANVVDIWKCPSCGWGFEKHNPTDPNLFLFIPSEEPSPLPPSPSPLPPSPASPELKESKSKKGKPKA